MRARIRSIVSLFLLTSVALGASGCPWWRHDRDGGDDHHGDHPDDHHGDHPDDHEHHGDHPDDNGHHDDPH